MVQKSRRTNVFQNRETMGWQEAEISARCQASRNKFEKGAAQYESSWVIARDEMADAEQVALGREAAEAAHQIHEVRVITAGNHENVCKA